MTVVALKVRTGTSAVTGRTWSKIVEEDVRAVDVRIDDEVVKPVQVGDGFDEVGLIVRRTVPLDAAETALVEMAVSWARGEVTP